MIELRATIDRVTVKGFVKKRGEYVEFADDYPAVLAENGYSLVYKATHNTLITKCVLKNGNDSVFNCTVDMPMIERGGTAHIHLTHPFSLHDTPKYTHEDCYGKIQQ